MRDIVCRLFNRKRITLLLLTAFLITGWLIFKNLELIYAQGQVSLYFQPDVANLPPDSSLKLMLDPDTHKIAFVRVELSFDPSKVALSEEVQTTPLLSNVIEKTSMADANATGSVVLVLALSTGDVGNSPDGIIEIAQLPFTAITEEINQLSDLLIDEHSVQVVDIDETELGLASVGSVSLILNVEEVPTSTPTPSPTTTPAEAFVSSQLSLQLDDQAFINEEISVDIYFQTDTPVSGVDAVLVFDPTSLEVVRIEDGKLLSDATLESIDNENGVVRVSQLEAAGVGFSGEGVVATLICKSQVLGQKEISFDFTLGDRSDSNAIELATGEDVLAAASGVSFEVLGHPSLTIHLQTPSENVLLGHSVDGDLQTANGQWSSDFSADMKGDFSVNPPDSFLGQVMEFVFKVNGFLRKRRSLEVKSGDNDIDLGMLLAGDLNDDGIINNVDLSLLYDSWFGSGIADYNKDGIINSVDHWVLTANFFAQDE